MAVIHLAFILAESQRYTLHVQVCKICMQIQTLKNTPQWFLTLKKMFVKSSYIYLENVLHVA